MNLPEAVQLTNDERSLYERIDWSKTEWPDWEQSKQREMLESVKQLAERLLTRKAFPNIRLKYFSDPDMNPGSRGKSRKRIFEMHGTSGEQILCHGNFVPHLNYMIHGPLLPPETISGFAKILDDDFGTSGMVLDQIRAFVRREVRRHELPKSAADQFFALAHEFGRHELANSVRSAAMSSRH